VLVPAEPMQLAPRSAHRFEEVELTRAALAWPIPGLAHDHAPVLDLLATILGHGDSSVLWQEIREKAGLVHTIDASAWNPGTTGLFCISFTCDAAKRGAATEAIRRELARCAARGFTAGQRKKALRQLAVGEINTRKTMSGQASRIGAAEVVVGDLDHSRSYFDHLRVVRPAQLVQALRTYLLPERLTSISLNPKASAPGAAPAVTAGSVTPDFSETTLPNGARLLLQRDTHLPNLHLRFLMQAGPLFEDPARRGATALLATMLAKDTRSRSAAAVARYIEEVGGSFYPFSGNNSLGLAVEVLPPDADRAVAVLGDAVLGAAFRPDTFATEREAQLADLQQDADDIVTYARKLVRQRFFGTHPLALDDHGDDAGVKALAASDLLALHRRLCVAGNVVLAVAGDFDPKVFAPKLTKFLSRIPSGPAPVWSARFGGAAAVGDFVERRPREQAVVLQAFPGPRAHADDFYVGEVADEIFSGMASRLFERVREEKGLAYFVRSGRVTGLDAGMFYFLAGTQPGREAEVLAELDAEIARVQAGGVEPAELARCHARLKAGRRQSMQTNSSRAMQAGLNALQGRPINDWKNYDGRVEAVTVADLGLFASRHFSRAQRTQLVVRP
jgi:zinc protease